jgi:hypothetical protein
VIRWPSVLQNLVVLLWEFVRALIDFLARVLGPSQVLRDVRMIARRQDNMASCQEDPTAIAEIEALEVRVGLGSDLDAECAGEWSADVGVGRQSVRSTGGEDVSDEPRTDGPREDRFPGQPRRTGSKRIGSMLVHRSSMLWYITRPSLASLGTRWAWGPVR